MDNEKRNTRIRQATDMATFQTPITDKITAKGFRIFHNGSDLRLWPDGLATRNQNQFIQQHKMKILAEVHSLWANPVRCKECRYWVHECRANFTKPMWEGGWSAFDLHHCSAFENRDP
ncbi:MAG: hypothetical protein RLZ25_2386 [Pseudomonadota bacterium]